ncbi:MAG: exonuclease subunit SbcD [bacterium]|nr:exonuclease subunit SbcD [Candidatus Colousia faecequi]
MKIIATSDWHIGNMFHGNDRLPEHKHFLEWLLRRIEEEKPDALLVAGDVFDNGNPSAAAQSAYYEFLADATAVCPDMKIVITAGNHDSAYRLEAPRPLLSRYKMEIRGTVSHDWDTEEKKLVVNYKDLMIHITNKDCEEVVVLAVPYLRSDVLTGNDYSTGVNDFLRELTMRARSEYPDRKIVMMAHMYAKGAEIAERNASEKIVVGGLEQVNMDGWMEHPDYLTCGHIHKRQHIWNTDWARYTGSILPMSFAEVDYKHGVDLMTIGDKVEVDFIEYTPQHKLRILPDDNSQLTPKELKKLIKKVLRERKEDGELSDDFEYLLMRVSLDKVDNDVISDLEEAVKNKDVVLCKIEKVMPALNVANITDSARFESIDDIINRDPMEALKETFAVINKCEMNEHQEEMLKKLINKLTT